MSSSVANDTMTNDGRGYLTKCIFAPIRINCFQNAHFFMAHALVLSFRLRFSQKKYAAARYGNFKNPTADGGCVRPYFLFQQWAVRLCPLQRHGLCTGGEAIVFDTPTDDAVSEMLIHWIEKRLKKRCSAAAWSKPWMQGKATSPTPIPHHGRQLWNRSNGHIPMCASLSRGTEPQAVWNCWILRPDFFRKGDKTHPTCCGKAQ